MAGSTDEYAPGLQDACLRWQSGRDGGSSLLRGAARVLTGVPHYFEAAFITGYEERARADQPAMGDARALLDAVAQSEHRDAEGWAVFTGVPDTRFGGRGLQAKPDQDPQIEAQLELGWIDMPLWGVSLSREIADGYGGGGGQTRFLFQLDGPFPAVPSWLCSGIKPEELELITGGYYEVISIDRVGENQDEVTLRWAGPSGTSAPAQAAG